MDDIREAVADRLERAADRMYNSGFLGEERRFRDAAASIRAGLSLAETKALEQQMLPPPPPRLLNRLTALAAQGEYDGSGGDGSGGDGSSAQRVALDDEVAQTDTESSGASQLLSTSVWNGLSSPFNSAQGGWIVASQEVDPNTNVTGPGGPFSSYVGQDVDPNTNMPPDGANRTITPADRMSFRSRILRGRRIVSLCGIRL